MSCVLGKMTGCDMPDTANPAESDLGAMITVQGSQVLTRLGWQRLAHHALTSDRQVHYYVVCSLAGTLASDEASQLTLDGQEVCVHHAGLTCVTGKTTADHSVTNITQLFSSSKRQT